MSKHSFTLAMNTGGNAGAVGAHAWLDSIIAPLRSAIMRATLRPYNLAMNCDSARHVKPLQFRKEMVNEFAQTHTNMRSFLFHLKTCGKYTHDSKIEEVHIPYIRHMTDCMRDGALLFEFARRSQLGEFDADSACVPIRDRCASQPRGANICPDCCIVMEIQGDEYVCGQCQRIAAHAECHITSESHCPSGGKDARHYGSSDPLRDKCASIYDTLIAQREEYTARIACERGIDYKQGSILFGDAPELARFVPSTEALRNTAARYIEIQRRATANGTPFVKCGGVKNEVIALLLHLECSKSGAQRSKREIAEMIGLSTDGFSRGQTLLMMQSAAGNFDMEAEEAMRENMILSSFNKTIGAYLDAKINAPLRDCAREHGEPIPEPCALYVLLCARYMQVMRALIRYAVKHHICPQSQPQTKIVGIIWFIACALKYRTTIEDGGIDIAACGIKRCTFIKFARAIKKNARLRQIVYVYIPHLKGRMDCVTL